MEQWEIDYRKQLEEELEDGYYQIQNDSGYVLGTGKQGCINYLVQLRKQTMSFRGLESLLTDPPIEVNTTGGATMNDFMELMNSLSRDNRPSEMVLFSFKHKAIEKCRLPRKKKKWLKQQYGPYWTKWLN